MDLDKSIKERHSVRKFSSKKPDWRKIVDCIDVVRYAPTAGHNSTVKIILVDEKSKILEIAEECQQDFVGQVHYLVVVCSSPSRLINAYGERGEKFNNQQSGAAIENFLLKLESEGLATCWVGYFDEDNIKNLLKIPEDIHIEAILPIGYEFEKPRTKKFRIELEQILYFNDYKNKKMKSSKKIDV